MPDRQEYKEKLQQVAKINAATGTPAAIMSSPTKFTRATFYGRKAWRTDNSGTVWIGGTDTNDQQPVKIVSGGEVTLECPGSGWYDLAEIYLDVEIANDGIVVVYS